MIAPVNDQLNALNDSMSGEAATCLNNGAFLMGSHCNLHARLAGVALFTALVSESTGKLPG
jgi:hypothetical protein